MFTQDTFNHINDWIDEIAKYTGPNILIVVIGNKYDLVGERKVTDEDIQVYIILWQEFERKNGIKVILTSAKSGNQVELAFKTTVESLIDKK